MKGTWERSWRARSRVWGSLRARMSLSTETWLRSPWGRESLDPDAVALPLTAALASTVDGSPNRESGRLAIVGGMPRDFDLWVFLRIWNLRKQRRNGYCNMEIALLEDWFSRCLHILWFYSVSSHWFSCHWSKNVLHFQLILNRFKFWSKLDVIFSPFSFF